MNIIVTKTLLITRVMMIIRIIVIVTIKTIFIIMATIQKSTTKILIIFKIHFHSNVKNDWFSLLR